MKRLCSLGSLPLPHPSGFYLEESLREMEGTPTVHWYGEKDSSLNEASYQPAVYSASLEPGRALIISAS